MSVQTNTAGNRVAAPVATAARTIPNAGNLSGGAQRNVQTDTNPSAIDNLFGVRPVVNPDDINPGPSVDDNGGGGGGDGGGNNADESKPPAPTDQPPQPIDTKVIVPSELIRTSALMVRDVGSGKRAPTCWFEPLGYCRDGMNRNGWCSWHIRHIFNGQSTGEEVAILNDDMEVELIKYNRLLTYIPMPLRLELVRVFPIVEMYDSLADIEANLNMGLLQFTLTYSNRSRSAADVSRIVREHKAYLMLMLRSSVNSGDGGRLPIEPLALVHTRQCVDYVSSQLNRRPAFDIDVTVVDPETDSLRKLRLQDCSALTISMLLQFDVPYGIPPSMNVMIGNSPAFQIRDRTLVVDQTKMHNGTYALDDCTQTYGSPCTLGMFRRDTNGDLSFFDRHFKRATEQCLDTRVDRQKLLSYTVGGGANGGLAAIKSNNDDDDDMDCD